MLGFKSRPSSATVTKEPEQPADRPAASSTPEVSIAPPRRGRWGRHLTFAIDQTGIQMAASVAGSRKVKLLDIRKTYFPAGAEGEAGKVSFITRTVAEYLERFGTPGAAISASVTGGETAFRTFQMPPLKSKAFAPAVRFEAKKQLPFPVEDCFYDFRPIGKTHSDGHDVIRVALLAATRKLVNEQLTPFDQTRREVRQIYHAQDVIGALLRYLPDFSDDHHYTLVNVERTRTEIAYYRGSNLEFYHICSVGSSFLANRSDLTIFEYFAESLAGEIQNSLDYYSGQYSGQFNTRIYIYGDLSYTDELIQLLHDHFGYEFRRFPVEDLAIDLGKEVEVNESLSVSLPVLAASLNHSQLANLLPPERKLRLALRQQAKSAFMALIGLACLLGLGWFALQSDLAAQQSRLASVTKQVDTFKSSELYDTYNHLKLRIEANQAYLDKIKPIPTYLSLNLKELSRLTPAPIRLGVLDYRPENGDRNLVLQGVVAPNSIPPEVVLAEFVENLSASPFYEKVSVLSYAKRPVIGGMEMEFQLAMRGTI